MRTIRFAAVRPNRWTRRWIGLGKVCKWLGISFGAAVAGMIAFILLGILGGVLLQVVAGLFSTIT